MAKKEFIFQWSFESAKEVEGRRAIYSVLLSNTGELSCNCNGWIFPKKDAQKDKLGKKIRTCKHVETKEIQSSYKDYHKKFLKGEKLPKILSPSIPTTTQQTEDHLSFGRMVELDQEKS